MNLSNFQASLFLAIQLILAAPAFGATGNLPDCNLDPAAKAAEFCTHFDLPKFLKGDQYVQAAHVACVRYHAATIQAVKAACLMASREVSDTQAAIKKFNVQNGQDGAQIRNLDFETELKNKAFSRWQEHGKLLGDLDHALEAYKGPLDSLGKAGANRLRSEAIGASEQNTCGIPNSTNSLDTFALVNASVLWAQTFTAQAKVLLRISAREQFQKATSHLSTASESAKRADLGESVGTPPLADPLAEVSKFRGVDEALKGGVEISAMEAMLKASLRDASVIETYLIQKALASGSQHISSYIEANLLHASGIQSGHLVHALAGTTLGGSIIGLEAYLRWSKAGRLDVIDIATLGLKTTATIIAVGGGMGTGWTSVAAVGFVEFGINMAELKIRQIIDQTAMEEMSVYAPWALQLMHANKGQAIPSMIASGKYYCMKLDAVQRGAGSILGSLPPRGHSATFGNATEEAVYAHLSRCCKQAQP